mmetsp:Transcript_28319/g.82024  ORF Transcript_28319/g.82024 Transcript_28319/m.82024 type:complete len:255 (+) Transcript_28319:626-1390(+)
MALPTSSRSKSAQTSLSAEVSARAKDSAKAAAAAVPGVTVACERLDISTGRRQANCSALRDRAPLAFKASATPTAALALRMARRAATAASQAEAFASKALRSHSSAWSAAAWALAPCSIAMASARRASPRRCSASCDCFVRASSSLATSRKASPRARSAFASGDPCNDSAAKLECQSAISCSCNACWKSRSLKALCRVASASSVACRLRESAARNAPSLYAISISSALASLAFATAVSLKCDRSTLLNSMSSSN